jgi:predicted ester cyclase
METREKDRALVQSFYEKVLSQTTAPDLTERMAGMLAASWESVGDYTGRSKNREQFGAQLQGFGALIPDLTWKIEELISAGDRHIVRGRAAGTPVGELFGVPPSGRRFEVMSIDIHTVADGRIARTYHIEDWASAIRQLRG